MLGAPLQHRETLDILPKNNQTSQPLIMKLLQEQFAELTERLEVLHAEENALRKKYIAEKRRMERAIARQGDNLFGQPIEEHGLFRVPIHVESCQRTLDKIKQQQATVANQIKHTQNLIKQAEIVEQGTLNIS